MRLTRHIGYSLVLLLLAGATECRQMRVAPRTAFFEVPAIARAIWADPATGQTRQTVSLGPGAHRLTSPKFAVDMALKIVY